jgi:hypothetical protein
VFSSFPPLDAASSAALFCLCHITQPVLPLLLLLLLLCAGVLQSRLRRSKASKMVVFFSNCDSVEFHHELFRRDLQLAYSHSNQQGQAPAAAEAVKLLGDVPVLKLHGDMRQPERTSSLVTFSKVCSLTSAALSTLQQAFFKGLLRMLHDAGPYYVPTEPARIPMPCGTAEQFVGGVVI